MPRNPNKAPCTVPGCRAWAIRGSNPPTCSPHRHIVASPDPDPGASPGCRPGPAEGQGDRQADPGQPGACPEADDSRPRVGAPSGNQNRLVHGFYATVLQPEDQDDLVAHAADPNLDAEIIVTRVALRRILGMLLTGRTPGPDGTPLTAWDYARFAGLAFQGTGAVSRLLRARQALTGGPQGDRKRAMNWALDVLSEEWNIQL